LFLARLHRDHIDIYQLCGF